eukprot:6065988-Alexandrium_andersonii.AAC.1
MHGSPAKTSGIELPTPMLGATASERTKVKESCETARRAQMLPLAVEHRRSVVCGGALAAFSWARICRPLRRNDVREFEAARFGICSRR